METCTAEYARLTANMGGLDCAGDPFITLRDPFSLQHWTLPLIEVTVREGADTGQTKARIVQRARVIFKEDSAAVDEMGDGGIQTRVFGTEAGAIPYLNLSFALLEQAVRRARAAHGP